MSDIVMSNREAEIFLCCDKYRQNTPEAQLWLLVDYKISSRKSGEDHEERVSVKSCGNGNGSYFIVGTFQREKSSAKFFAKLFLDVLAD